jgi:hypothetical protein
MIAIATAPPAVASTPSVAYAAPLPPRVPPRSGRERVPPEVVIEAINRALVFFPECAGVRVGARAWEVRPDAAGCNWSEGSLVVRVHGTVGAGAFNALRDVIAEARARYDVVLPDPGAEDEDDAAETAVAWAA